METLKKLPDNLTELSTVINSDITLSNIKSSRLYVDGWQDWEYTLTDKDITDISEILGGHSRTQYAVACKLRRLSSLPSYWAYDRIMFCKHSKRWSYCAGQDYPAELNTIRTYIKNL